MLITIKMLNFHFIFYMNTRNQFFHLIFIFCLFFTPFLQAQINEDFSDGNLNEAPQWLGHLDKFSIGDGVLQLNDSSPGSSNTQYIYTSAPTSNTVETVWQFWVRLTFDPSTSNFAEIYLVSDQTNFEENLNGYFVKIGGISGADDAIELYKQEGNSKKLLIAGTKGTVATSPVLAAVRVVRTPDNQWELWTDYSGGDNFQMEGIANDDTPLLGTYFGIVCHYTSSRSSNFFFDNIFINPIIIDEQSPKLLEALAVNNTLIQLKFDESLAEASIIPQNFSINNGIGSPSNAALSSENASIVELSLSSPLQSGNNYEVTANLVQDLAGNTATAQSAIFNFFQTAVAGPGDILVTEIFADPSPSVGLPEFEYLELYNNSQEVIDLGQLLLSNGGAPKAINPFLLQPSTYVILCDISNASAFEPFGQTAFVSGMPALTNGGDEVIISNKNGETLISFEYDISWYQDNQKSQGGWSIELVDLALPMDCGNNWLASVSLSGGTPGTVNSRNGNNPDKTGPRLLSIAPESDFEITLSFNESLDLISLTNNSFQINNGIRVIDFQPFNSQKSALILTLEQPLAKGILYQLSISEGDLKDCLGNPGNLLDAEFAIPEPILPEDIIINELLFDPETGGEDFVEIYNRSDKIVDLNGLQLINRQKQSGTISQTINTNFLLFPGAYVVITDLPSDIMTRYITAGAERFIQNDLPTLDDKSGNLTLSWNNVTIDSFDYDASYHFSLLTDKNGVSLERLQPDAPTNNAGNWHSASSSIGYATPGLENSQFFESSNNSELLDEMIRIEENILSPDGDGFQDILSIQYETDAPGYLLNAQIFDLQGRTIKNLVRNELLGNRGLYKWDGTTSEGTKARIGIYIIWFELSNGQGKVAQLKKPIVVAGNFK